MPNTITNRQMAFIILLTLTSSSIVVLPKVLAQYAGSGSWLTILLASALFACAAWVWAKLNASFPGMMITDYSKEIAGRAVSALLSSLFLVYFLIVQLSQYLFMSDMLKTNFLPDTPPWATTLAALPVIGFVAYKGVTNVARLVEIFGVVYISVAVVFHIIMAASGDFINILPLFNQAETGRYLRAIVKMVYPMLGFEVLAVLPFTQKHAPKAGKTAVLAILIIGLFYVLIVESCFVMVNIDEITHYNFPLVVAIRQVELPTLKVFQRPDILYLTAGFVGLFGGMAVTYLSVVELLCRLLPRVKRSIVTSAVGAVMFGAFTVTNKINNITDIITGVITNAGILVAVAMPAALLIIAKVKKRGNKKMA